MLSPLLLSVTFLDSIDTRSFRHAFQSVVDRSDALRTVFVEEAGTPRRHVLPYLPMAMNVVDLSATYSPLRAYEQWSAERNLRTLSPHVRPFDSTLVRIGAQHLIWRLSAHRFVADMRSLLLIYHRTAEAYQAIAHGAADVLPMLPAYEEYAPLERQRTESATVASLPNPKSHSRAARPVPIAGERYVTDLGEERTSALRRAACELAARGVEDQVALFLVCAAGLAALLAVQRGCRTVTIDTELDQRHTGSWQETIGRISQPRSLTIEAAPGDTPGTLLERLVAAWEQRGQQTQASPVSERPADACRALLHVDDMTFPTFAGMPVKVERFDVCYSQCRPRAGKGMAAEPGIYLQIDSFNSSENLNAIFTFCSGDVSNRSGPEVGDRYLRLLDSVLDKSEQAIILANAESR
jgi:hypothetical protein